MGLVSPPGGVHSHSEHLYALLRMAKTRGAEPSVYPCLLGWTRCAPPAVLGNIWQIWKTRLKKIGVGRIATISGRYYAMDRDRRWDRVEKAFRALQGGWGGVPRLTAPRP